MLVKQLHATQAATAAAACSRLQDAQKAPAATPQRHEDFASPLMWLL
jgi:hypothetical protein